MGTRQTSICFMFLATCSLLSSVASANADDRWIEIFETEGGAICGEYSTDVYGKGTGTSLQEAVDKCMEALDQSCGGELSNKEVTDDKVIKGEQHVACKASCTVRFCADSLDGTDEIGDPELY